MPTRGTGTVTKHTNWICDHINKRVCQKYVATINDGDLCQCGYSRRKHHQDSVKDNGDVTGWNIQQDTKPTKTDAFGQIEFSGVSQRIAEYVRVDYRTHMGVMMELLKDKWGMKAPNLLISVTGSVTNINVKPLIKRLVDVAKDAGAWIITGGMHEGVTKQIGNALHDKVAHGTHTDLDAIGIASWGCVRGKTSLTNNDRWIAKYDKDSEGSSEGKPQCTLDPNHSQFILVDDGTQYKSGGEIDFRAKLEAHISQKWHGNADKIPIVSVVLQGGPDTIRTVHSTIMEGTPVVIFEGSGGAAEILAHAYTENEERSDELKLQESLKQLIKNEFPQLKDNIEEMVTLVIECVGKCDLMTVKQLESFDEATQMDMVILNAILQVKTSEQEESGFEKKQMKLALMLNCINIAEELIENTKLEKENMEELTEMAILDNRFEFVRLFLYSGIIDLQMFLTEKRLLMFFKKTDQMKKHMKHNKKDISDWNKMNVCKMLKKLVGHNVCPDDPAINTKSTDDGDTSRTGTDDSDSSQTGTDDSDASQTGTDDRDASKTGRDNGSPLLLMLWAILRHNFELAKLIWRQGKEGIAAALLAVKLVKAMENKEHDPVKKEKLLEMMVYFERLAVGVLTQCHNTDERKTQQLLTRQLPHIAKTTPLILAGETENKKFIATAACQSLLNRIWMGKMEPTTKRRSIFFALLFPLLVWFSTIIDFRSDAWEEKDEQTDRRSPYGYNGTCWKQLIAFYRSPIVIYCGYCLSHVIFLGLFSYILLTDFHLEVTKKEWVIVFWVGVVIMEEIRQMRNDVNRFKNKIDGFRHHFKDMWNFLDAVTLIAFFVGFLFRYVSPHYMIMRTISCLEVARIIFALDLMLFYLRTLDIYYLHRKLGPQLVMITEMMVDMWYVIIIIMVFVVAYGVALQAILYPNSPLDFTLMSKMFKKAYFQIYGELFLEELGGTLDCETTLMANSTLPRCPQNTDFIPTFLMAIYILFTNVLLLNLLIAMFSNTFNKIQMDTDEHWFFLRYFLIKEFDDRPSLAPPLTILYHLYLGIRKCNNSYCGKCERPTDFKVKYLDDLDKELIRWEKENVDDYVNKTDRQQTLENRVEELQNSVYNMAGDLEDMKDMKDMLRKMAEQMEKILGERNGQ